MEIHEKSLKTLVADLNSQILKDTKRKAKMCVRRDRYLFPEKIKSKIKSLIQGNDYDEDSWEGLLGDGGKVKFLHDGKILTELTGDGNVYDHSISQSRLIKQYGLYDIETGIITKEDYAQLILLGLIHDLGEILVGDTIYDLKVTDEEKERQAGISIIKEIYKGDSAILDEILQTYDINFDNTHKLHKIFKLYEKMSYMRGAMQAFKHKDTILFPEWIIHNVIFNQIPHLHKAMLTNPSIANFMNDNFKTFIEMINHVDNSGFKDKDTPGNDEKYITACMILRQDIPDIISKISHLS